MFVPLYHCIQRCLYVWIFSGISDNFKSSIFSLACTTSLTQTMCTSGVLSLTRGCSLWYTAGICSHQTPCYPGTCRWGSSDCDCTSGFTTTSSASENCLTSKRRRRRRWWRPWWWWRFFFIDFDDVIWLWYWFPWSFRLTWLYFK